MASFGVEGRVTLEISDAVHALSQFAALHGLRQVAKAFYPLCMVLLLFLCGIIVGMSDCTGLALWNG